MNAGLGLYMVKKSWNITKVNVALKIRRME